MKQKSIPRLLLLPAATPTTLLIPGPTRATTQAPPIYTFATIQTPGLPNIKEDERFPGCRGSGPVDFEHAPMRVADPSRIDPYGLVVWRSRHTS